jgi:hypothetical protein
MSLHNIYRKKRRNYVHVRFGIAGTPRTACAGTTTRAKQQKGISKQLFVYREKRWPTGKLETNLYT